MATRLTGAALNKKVENECRKMLAEYGVAIGYYQLKDIHKASLGSDMQPIMTMTFVNTAAPFDSPSRGLEIQVTEIHPANDGTLDQVGSNYGRLCY